MRRSDAGPLGVATLVLVLLVQVCALASLPHGLAGAAGLVLAAVTGRVAVVLATGWPPARPVRVRRPGRRADQRRGPGREPWRCCWRRRPRAGCCWAGGRPRSGPCWPRWPAWRPGPAAGPGAARRRLGGMTGDVFGAIIELGTATVLLVLVLSR